MFFLDFYFRPCDASQKGIRFDLGRWIRRSSSENRLILLRQCRYLQFEYTEWTTGLQAWTIFSPLNADIADT